MKITTPPPKDVRADSVNDQIQMLILMSELVGSSQWLGRLPYDWSKLYRHLLAEGMCWEFSDVFHRLIVMEWPAGDSQVDSVLRALGLLSPTPNLPQARKEAFDRMCKDWEEEVQDEPTLFALMNIFTTMALMYCKDPKSSDGADHICMALAGERAAKLHSQDDMNPLS